MRLRVGVKGPKFDECQSKPSTFSFTEIYNLEPLNIRKKRKMQGNLSHTPKNNLSFTEYPLDSASWAILWRTAKK